MKYEITDIIERLMDSFDKSNKDAYAKLIVRTVSDLTETGYDMKDPDVFSTILVFQQNNVMELVAEEFHEPCKKKENQHKANFVFTHYDFLENHIRKLIENRCGSGCVADRCRTIIREYLKWLISGELNEFNPEIECYWIPKFGIYSDWFKYCDSLYELYHGRLQNYLEIYNKLLTCEIRRYKHLQHNWFLKLNDAEPFKFTTTYDRHTENPLDAYYTQNDMYLIQKRVIPKDLYERFSEPAANERQMRLLKAIPIHEVEKIYYETEEIYI